MGDHAHPAPCHGGAETVTVAARRRLAAHGQICRLREAQWQHATWASLTATRELAEVEQHAATQEQQLTQSMALWQRFVTGPTMAPDLLTHAADWVGQCRQSLTLAQAHVSGAEAAKQSAIAHLNYCGAAKNVAISLQRGASRRFDRKRDEQEAYDVADLFLQRRV